MWLYEDIRVALTVDLVALTLCTVLLLRYARLSHSHPATVYLCFHALVVSSRLWGIVAGSETLFTYWGSLFEPVTEGEITRAAQFADLTLAAMTLACIRASVVERRRQVTRAQNPAPSDGLKTLSLVHIWAVVAVALPTGLVGLVLLGSVPGIEKPQLDLGAWQESSWVTVTMTWAGLSLLALIYWYGFKWWLSAPMAAYLLIMGIQGYHRFRAIIPLLLLLQIYLDRRQKRWPPAIVVSGIVAAMLLFYPMKTIGRMAQEGATFGEITESSSEILRDVVAGQNGDQMILDQLASTLTLVDRTGNYYYGTTYLALLVAPVPRQWWPQKPGLADYIADYSAPSRPMAEMGMVPTFIGEFYLNFGYAGVILLSYLMAYGLTCIYFRAYRSSYYSVLRFGYLLVACNLVQVYRDGLMSLAVFTLINMMPLSVIVLIHLLRPSRGRRLQTPSGYATVGLPPGITAGRRNP